MAATACAMARRWSCRTRPPRKSRRPGPRRRPKTRTDRVAQARANSVPAAAAPVASAAIRAAADLRAPVNDDGCDLAGQHMNPSRIFVLRPVATTLLMIAILVVGMIGYTQLPLAALPEVSYPPIHV